MTIRYARPRLAGPRRALIAAGLGALTIGLLAPSAAAQAADRNRDSLTIDQVMTGSLLIDGNKTRLVRLESITQLLNEAGKAIGPARTVALRTTTENPVLGEYSCVYRGKGNKNFRALTPREIYRNDDIGKVQAQFHTYRLAEARKVGAGAKSVQFEVCGVGGADLDDKRLRRIGLGIAYPDATSTYKIGQAWQSGQTPENYTTNLGFKVAPHKAIEISGGISQTPTNKLLGSFSTPFPAAVDAFARNAVNAWWQDDCVGGVPCARWNGSKDFHGTVVQGLWEFSPIQARGFAGFTVSTFLSTN